MIQKENANVSMFSQKILWLMPCLTRFTYVWHIGMTAECSIRILFIFYVQLFGTTAWIVKLYWGQMIFNMITHCCVDPNWYFSRVLVKGGSFVTCILPWPGCVMSAGDRVLGTSLNYLKRIHVSYHSCTIFSGCGCCGRWRFNINTILPLQVL